MTDPLFLRRIFLLDALSCAACVALFAPFAGLLAPLTGLDAAFIRIAGLALIPCAMLFLWLGTRPQPPLAISVLAILGNLLWVIQSLIVIAGHSAELTGFGVAIVAGQAAAVLVLALLESHGVQRMRRAIA